MITKFCFPNKQESYFSVTPTNSSVAYFFESAKTIALFRTLQIFYFWRCQKFNAPPKNHSLYGRWRCNWHPRSYRRSSICPSIASARLNGQQVGTIRRCRKARMVCHPTKLRKEWRSSSVVLVCLPEPFNNMPTVALQDYRHWNQAWKATSQSGHTRRKWISLRWLQSGRRSASTMFRRLYLRSGGIWMRRNLFGSNRRRWIYVKLPWVAMQLSWRGRRLHLFWILQTKNGPTWRSWGKRQAQPHQKPSFGHL